MMSGAPRSAYVSIEEATAIMGYPPTNAAPPPRRHQCVCDAIEPRVRPPGLTYVASQGGYVKIGTSRDQQTLGNRLRALQHRYGITRRPLGLDWTLPLTLVAASPVNIEHHLHDACAEWHARGEWFHDTDALRLVVADEVMWAF